MVQVLLYAEDPSFQCTHMLPLHYSTPVLISGRHPSKHFSSLAIAIFSKYVDKTARVILRSSNLEMFCYDLNSDCPQPHPYPHQQEGPE